MSNCTHPPEKQQIHALHQWPVNDHIECRECWETRPYTPEMDEQRRTHGLEPFAEHKTGWMAQEMRQMINVMRGRT